MTSRAVGGVGGTMLCIELAEELGSVVHITDFADLQNARVTGSQTCTTSLGSC
jgi:hypothetical protein